MPDWSVIKAEYIKGKSYRKLEEEYGVSRSVISKHGIKEKWGELRRQKNAKVERKLVDTLAEQDIKKADKFNSIADKLLARIEKDIDKGILTKRGYRDITGALKDLKDIKGIKSELDIKEQIERINKLRKEAAEDTETKEIKVIMSDVEDYSK